MIDNSLSAALTGIKDVRRGGAPALLDLGPAAGRRRPGVSPPKEIATLERLRYSTRVPDPVVHRVAIRVPLASKMLVVVVVVNVLASLLSSVSTEAV
jgi:hypothetical protein